jgi:hypothetical protein
MNALHLLAVPAALLAITACSTAPPAPPEMPPALQLAAGERWVGTLPARGVQIYECRVADGKAAWAFVAPEATLFDGHDEPVGQHGAGPFWQAQDGSRVEGQSVARADAPAAGAIPWLLLDVHSTAGAGRLQAVTHIRRINTQGGVAPQAGCDAASAGMRQRIAYTADYLLYEGR